MTAYYRVNFTVANNEDLRQSFVLSDTGQVPIDLTGADLRMAVSAASGAAALAASIGNGRIVVHDAPAGRFELVLPSAALTPLQPGVYRHDLVLTNAAGHMHRIWSGGLTLEQGVTQ